MFPKLKFGCNGFKVRIYRFQSLDVTFPKFGYNVFKVRIYRFQSSDIPFSKLGYNVFIFPQNIFFYFFPKILHNLLSLRYGADLGRSRFVTLLVCFCYCSAFSKEPSSMVILIQKPFNVTITRWSS